MKFWYSVDKALTGFRAGSDAVDKRKVSRGLDGIKPRSFKRTVHILDTTLTEISYLTNKYDDEVYWIHVSQGMDQWELLLARLRTFELRRKQVTS
jgi:hypothetical protein